MVGPVVKISEEDLPKRPNICYLGGKTYDELPAYLSGWDVALMPFAMNESTQFISPTKTPEYLAGGKPVVSTPIGCQGLDLVDDVDAVVREGWSEFAEAVSNLLADAPKRGSIGERARATVEERFSWTAVADRAYESYEALSASVSAPSAR